MPEINSGLQLVERQFPSNPELSGHTSSKSRVTINNICVDFID